MQVRYRSFGVFFFHLPCRLTFQAAHGLESLAKQSAWQQLEFKELRQWREERRAALVSQTRGVEHEDGKTLSDAVPDAIFARPGGVEGTSFAPTRRELRGLLHSRKELNLRPVSLLLLLATLQSASQAVLSLT